MNNFEWWLAWKHLKHKQQHKYLSFITLVSIIGVALGVASLIVVLSVMNGFSSDIQSRILKSRSHIEIRSLNSDGLEVNLAKEIKAIDPKIKDVIPFIQGDVIFMHDGRVGGGVVRGLEIKDASQMLNLRVTYNEKVKSNLPPIFLGGELALVIGGHPGAEISLVSPIETVGPFGNVPKTLNLIVKGVSRTGVYEYDAGTGYIPLKIAQKFFDLPNKVTNFALMIDDPQNAQLVAKEINAKSNGRWSAKSWGELNKILISALRLEKFGMFITLLLAILIASFNILSTMHLMVKEKQKEISIMKAMGAKAGQIRKIFWFEGALIGIFGTSIGLILGTLFCEFIKIAKIQMPGIYYISTLPVAPKPLYFISVALTALFLSFTATLYPASRAAKMNPLRGICYEK